jgi:hypothetical protein
MVQPNLMLPVSIMGLIFNLIQMKILDEDQGTPEHHMPERVETDNQAKKIKDDTVKVSLLEEEGGQQKASSSRPA